MKPLKDSSQNYLEILLRRSRKSAGRVTQPHQFVGLEIAQMLFDKKHQSLYIKLAKHINHHKLISIAKSVAEKEEIKNKGAYFMTVLKENSLLAALKTGARLKK